MKKKQWKLSQPTILAVVIVVIIGVLAAYTFSGGAPTITSIQPTAQTVSGLLCSDGNIEGTITNTLNQQLAVEDFRVLFNGNVVNPATLRCDKTVLQPGESTQCLSMQGVVPVAGANEIAVVLGTESTIEAITC
jgi:hypothetical protein